MNHQQTEGTEALEHHCGDVLPSSRDYLASQTLLKAPKHGRHRSQAPEAHSHRAF